METTIRILLACIVLLVVTVRVCYCCVVHYDDIFSNKPFKGEL